MSYAPELPDPLAHKIAGWNLAVQIQLELLEELDRHISQAGTADSVQTFDFFTTDRDAGVSYGFYVQYRTRVDSGKVVLLDMDIDCLPQDNPAK